MNISYKNININLYWLKIKLWNLCSMVDQTISATELFVPVTWMKFICRANYAFSRICIYINKESIMDRSCSFALFVQMFFPYNHRIDLKQIQRSGSLGSIDPHNHSISPFPIRLQEALILLL